MSKNNINTNNITTRQIDKYDGQRLYIKNEVIYELGNYLGGGAAGSVYQGIQIDKSNINLYNKEIAIKILSPLGYKTHPTNILTKCSIVYKGNSLTNEQINNKSNITVDNIYWLYNHSIKQVIAAYEDPLKDKQLRELPLSKCIEIWGYQPFGNNLNDNEIEKYNIRSNNVYVQGESITLPYIPCKYIKWLKNRDMICREMKNMLLIGGHPNIIDLYEVLELVQETKTTLFLILDYAAGGMLFERIKTNYNGISTEDFARKYFTQLLSGIEYCHGKGVAHRDLKPENLLLSDVSDSAILKIADFGFSTVIFSNETNIDESNKVKSIFKNEENTHDKQYNKKILNNNYDEDKDNDPPSLRRLRSVVGSPHYIAPEISSDDPSGYDGRKVDMWSAGVILYSLLTGALPFNNDIQYCNRFKRYKQWLNTDYQLLLKENKPIVLPTWFCPNNYSSLVNSLLVKLLHFDPLARLSATQAATHPWCLGHSAMSLYMLRESISEYDINLTRSNSLLLKSNSKRKDRKKSKSPEISNILQLDHIDDNEIIECNNKIKSTSPTNKKTSSLDFNNQSPKS